MRQAAALIVLSTLACRPSPPALASDSATAAVAVDPPADSSGALAGPVGQSGIRSVIVPRDTVSDSARMIDEVAIEMLGAEVPAPPVYLMLTDPEGRQTGMAPGRDSAVVGIPGSQYITPIHPDSVDVEALEFPPVILLFGVARGRYRLEIAGIRARRFSLDYAFGRVNGARFGPGGWNCQAVPGVTDTVWIEVTTDTVRLSNSCRDAR